MKQKRIDKKRSGLKTNLYTTSVTACRYILFLVIAFLLLTGVSMQVDKITAHAARNSSPYQIRVNRIHNTVTVYEKDSKGEYTVPIKAMLCSVGVNLDKTSEYTPTGSFNTSAKYRWRPLFGDVFGQYATRITGNILFHSVYYETNNRPDTLNAEEFNKLGERASKGCIRLNCADAKWIYDNCPIGTNVVIYDDEKSPGPLGKPDGLKLPEDAIWDPTDPSPLNPYKKTVPSIKGAVSKTVDAGVEFDPLEGVTAYSSVGIDISDKLVIKGEVDVNKAGKYKIQYIVTDAIGRSKKKTVTIIVNDNEIVPVIEGTKDRVISEGMRLTDNFLLSGVNAYYGTRKYKKSDIAVECVKKDELSYEVTYKVIGDNEKEVTASSTIYVDHEAPNILCDSNEIEVASDVEVTREVALSYVTITDNYSNIALEDVKVTINELTNQVDLVMYEVSDGVGNIATKSIKFLKN